MSEPGEDAKLVGEIRRAVVDFGDAASEAGRARGYEGTYQTYFDTRGRLLRLIGELARRCSRPSWPPDQAAAVLRQLENVESAMGWYYAKSLPDDHAIMREGIADIVAERQKLLALLGITEGTGI